MRTLSRMPFSIEAAPPAKQDPGPREGRVDSIKFTSADTGFSILNMDVKGKREVWVGTLPNAFVGANMRAEGTWEQSKYGQQFRVGSAETPPPKEHAAMVSFIAGLADGVGPKTAERIVKHFGQEVWSVFETAPERVAAEISGLGAKKADALCKAWSGQKDLGRVIVWLQGHGLGTGLANRIIRTYGGRAMSVVQTQPYRLAMDIAGIGFRKADEIARGIGIRLTDPERVQAGIMYVLEESFVGQGHCFAWDHDLVTKATETLSVGSSLVTEGLGRLEKNNRVKTEQDGTKARVFPRRLAETEAKVAWYVARLMQTPGEIKGAWYGAGSKPTPLPIEEACEVAILDAEKGGTALSPAQAEAVRTIAKEKVMVLTGGPGCGKSFTVNVILNALEKAGAEFEQAAPTGKAAKRMRELTGRDASTVHSLLGYDPKTGKFIHNEESTLPTDVLVVDEFSMMAIDLTRHLLAALAAQTRLIIVGDVDQLPSVGAGAVLRDIIESAKVPVVRLTQIFRQAARSPIITAAHAINSGQVPTGESFDNPKSEFLIVPAENMEDPGVKIVELVTKIIPAKFGIEHRDIQVLCPKKDGKAGVNPLNRELQTVLNPEGKAYHRGDATFRVKDRVMQLKNDYARSVFNGDVGYVTDVFDSAKDTKNSDPVLRVQFDEMSVDYSAKQLHELSLAYACTVHKMQGSQYPAIVVPVLTSQFIMLSRNLVYTAVTRAQRLVVLVAEQRAMKIALAEIRKESRNTRLSYRIQEAMDAGALLLD